MATRNKVLTTGFFRDRALDFRTRVVLGAAVHGASEPGAVLATVGRVEAQHAWYREWCATADATERAAVAAREAGHLVSARGGFLRAATYWACALGGVDAFREKHTEAILLPTFRRHRACWDAFIDCSGGAHERVNVRYEDTTLPGYLLRPDDSGRPRPTLVVTNGSDGALSDLWSGAGVAAALERDWNAFVYDGPGQQSMLFERGIGFRPDWEAVLTPVLDALLSRTDVDADRLAGYGLSQAGFWLPRALAFEHRLRAAVIDPGVVDVSTPWMAQLGARLTAQLDGGDREAFERGLRLATRIPALGRTLKFRARPYRHDSWFDLFTTVRTYRLLAADGARVRTPLLITDPEGEEFWPGQSRRLAGLVREAELAGFTAAEGADRHCEPLGRLVVEQRVFDWLDDRLAR
ncbi:alpha/beta hydrolase family protein [Prauserella endophytica]|uniref:Dipeptidyl aminopeptidase n=1 Tax=Prauserella endophytica TaxID=1592324 RepID=A0ABY2S863_9PSEU|nr:dipeptidyl aminopeptidase [Prauserella endophytica]TKG72114.1 dipeptidyl aminopeptidase [Prauserella endophytica]